MYMVNFGLEQVSSVETAKIHVILCGYAVDVRLYRCVLIKRRAVGIGEGARGAVPPQ